MARIAVLSVSHDLLEKACRWCEGAGYDFAGYASLEELSLEHPVADLVVIDLRPVSRDEFQSRSNACMDIILGQKRLRAARAVVIKCDPYREGLQSSLSMGAMGYIRMSPFEEPLVEEDRLEFLDQVGEVLSFPPYEVVDFYKSLPNEYAFCHGMVESLNIPLLVFDSNDEIVFMNLSAMARFGYIPQQIYRKNWRMLLSESNNPVLLNMFVDAVRHTLCCQMDFTFRTRTGEEFLGMVNGSRMFDSTSLEMGLVIVSIQDRSDRQVLEEQVQHLQKMESVARLAGGIAHDFNNILGAIMGHASLLEMNLTPGSEEGEDVQRIIEATKQGSQLAMQLLGFARGGKYAVQPIDLRQIIEETLRLFPAAFHENITIRRQFAADVANIEGDTSQWKQVLTNLFINARDAMPKGGEIQLGLRNVRARDLGQALPLVDPHAHPGLHVELTLRDTGVGMTPEVREKAFDPFFTTKEKGRGTGLGLSMVFGIVKNHGGHILLESEPGKGTSFRIFMPASSKAAVRDEERIIQSRGGTETILIVDDQKSIREVAERSLKRLGYRTMTACNGEEALEHFSANGHDIDLVLADLIMPKMGGRELFYALKERRPDIRVLLISGYSQQGAAGELLRDGARGFLPKPYDLDSLASAVRLALDE